MIIGSPDRIIAHTYQHKLQGTIEVNPLVFDQQQCNGQWQRLEWQCQWLLETWGRKLSTWDTPESSSKESKVGHASSCSIGHVLMRDKQFIVTPTTFVLQKLAVVWAFLHWTLHCVWNKFVQYYDRSSNPVTSSPQTTSWEKLLETQVKCLSSLCSPTWSPPTW